MNWYKPCEHGSMLNRRHWVDEHGAITAWSDRAVNPDESCEGRQIVTPAEILAAARQAVESGTIEGEVGERCAVHRQDWSGGHTSHCEFEPVLVIPVAALGADDEAAAKAEREERG